MGKFLQRRIRTIFIMLGHNCNFSCKYCMQRPVVTHQITNKINLEILDFIKECAEQNDGKPLALQFYGGEPLIHFNNIKQIVKNTYNIPNIKYSFISNGAAITDEMVELFNSYEFSTLISWDGRNTEYTRGKDVFKDKEIKDKLFKLNHLGLSGVLTSYCYPKEFLEDCQVLADEYEQIHGYCPFINLDELFDTGIKDRTLFDIDYDKIYDDMCEMVDDYIYRQDNMIYTKRYYIQGYIDTLKDSVENTNKTTICCCSNGHEVINLDLEGKLYNCHNSQDILGNIHTPYINYLDNVIKLDNTKECFEKKCKDCDVYSICKGGCKLISLENRENYCNLKRSVFLPILHRLLDFNETC